MNDPQKQPRLSPAQKKALLQIRNGPVKRTGLNKLQINTYEALVRKGLVEAGDRGYQSTL